MLDQVERLQAENNFSQATGAVSPVSCKEQPALPLTWRLVLALALLSILAFLIFPIEPLYADNQNTKFLYGLAKAGVGNLANDWLIAQGSNLPIFDALVYLTQKFVGVWGFYAWHLAAIAVFTITSYGIARVAGLTQPDRFGANGRWFLPIFAAWFIGLNGSNATDQLFEGVADQYINGPVFEPASFGVLALLGLLLFRLRQAGWATVLIVASAWIHPVYAIPGLMLLGGMLVARWRLGAATVDFPVTVFLAGVLGCVASAGFTYSLLQPVDPALQAEAVRFITEVRIPHHSLPEVWFRTDAISKLLLVSLAIWLTRRDPLGWVLLTTSAGIVASALWVLFTRDMSLALAAPWRASAIVVPAANAILLARAIQAVASRPALTRIGLGLTGLVMVICVGVGARNFIVKRLNITHEPYMDWVRDNAQPGDQFLTPVNHGEFRLITRQPQYASWKTHPHRGSGVREWQARIQRAQTVTKSEPPSCDALSALAHEGVTHLVRPNPNGDPHCANWVVVYSDVQYTVSAYQP